MRDVNSKLNPWSTLNAVAGIALLAWSWFEYGRKAPLTGPITWAFAALLISVLGEALYSGRAGISLAHVPLEASRDNQPLWYWLLIGLNVLLIMVVINLAYMHSA